MLLLLLSCSCYQPVNGCSSFSLVASFPLASKGLLEQRLVATQNFADGRIREWQKSLEPLSISSSNCHPLGDPILILLSQKRTEEEKKKKKNFANCYPATLTTKRGKTIWNPSRFISTPSGQWCAQNFASSSGGAFIVKMSFSSKASRLCQPAYDKE